ncbi:MAG: hypothetical protein WBG86_06855 [Polyangiales bacterium]
MRYILCSLVFVALACSKAEPPAEPEAPSTAEAAPAADAAPDAAPDSPATPKKAPPPPETAPSVTLLDAGKPPLQELRRTFKKGQKETMSFAVGETVSMKGGGWKILHTSLVMAQTIDLETVAVSKDGVADVKLEVRGAKEVPDSVPEPTTKQMDPTGVTGSYKINTEGVITEVDLNPPPKSLTVAKPFLTTMRTKLRWMAPPFPKEPVGIGAKWTVTVEVNEYLTRIKEEATVELVERTDSEIVLKFEVEGGGTIHHAFEKQPQDVVVEAEGSGQATLNPKNVVPSSSKLAQKLVQTATLVGADVPDGPTVQTLTYDVKIRSK